MMSIRGRGYPAPYWRIEPSSDEVLIRVDDSERPDMWIEIRIPLHLWGEFYRQGLLRAAGHSADEVGGNPHITNRGPLKIDSPN